MSATLAFHCGDFVLLASDCCGRVFHTAVDWETVSVRKLVRRDNGLVTLQGNTSPTPAFEEALRGATERNAILHALDDFCAPHLAPRPGDPVDQASKSYGGNNIISAFTWPDGGLVRVGLYWVDNYFAELRPGAARALLPDVVPSQTRRTVVSTLSGMVRPSPPDAIPHYARLARLLMADVSKACDIVSADCHIGVHERGKPPRLLQCAA